MKLDDPSEPYGDEEIVALIVSLGLSARILYSVSREALARLCGCGPSPFRVLVSSCCKCRCTKGGVQTSGSCQRYRPKRGSAHEHALSESYCLALRYMKPVGTSCCPPLYLYASLALSAYGFPKGSCSAEKTTGQPLIRFVTFRVEPRASP